MPFPDVEFPIYIVEDRQDLVAAIGYTILEWAARHNNATHDSDIFAALTAQAETYRTLSSGIYFERPPDAPVPRELYENLAAFIKKYQAEDAGTRRPRLKDTEIFHLLVFMLRLGKHHSNGRPLSRSFLGFLRTTLPMKPAPEAEPPRIIVP